MVEQFSRGLVVGWISVPPETPPVQVELYLGPLRVAGTYATVGPSMSGSDSVLRGGSVKTSRAPLGAPKVHSWQLPNIPGPPDDRRNSGQQIRTFSFRVRDVWRYVKRSTRVTVRVNDQRLPIYGHGMFLKNTYNGKESLAALQEKFDQGYLFSQEGRLQLSKRLDTEWQAKVMGLYDVTRRILADRFGYDVFFVYGTLLGAVREGGYIGHDIDFDAAYLSERTSGPEAAEELVEIALALVAEGLDVECMRTALHIHDAAEPSTRIDLFHAYFDDAGHLAFPFGIAGTSTIVRDDWRGTREIAFPGGRGLVPVNGEQLVEHLYGADWRRPKPGFNWNLDRTARASAGMLTPRQRARAYWANYYAHHDADGPSTFFGFVGSRADIPNRVIDIGCGDGRDSCAFGAAGRTVLGIDQCSFGVEKARRRALEMELPEGVHFETCDVGDVDRLSLLLAEEVSKGEGEPVLFYLRLLLDAVPEGVQHSLFRTLRAQARAGDVLAAEFLSDSDDGEPTSHGDPLRRPVNVAAVEAELLELGFEIVDRFEGAGLPPEQGQDPALGRILARREPDS